MKPLADVLRDIVNGQRAAAEHREELGDLAVCAGDLAAAGAYWSAADAARRQARATLEELAALERARWDSTEYEAQTSAIQAAALADRAKQAAHEAEVARRAEERVVEARKAAKPAKGRAA